MTTATVTKAKATSKARALAAADATLLLTKPRPLPHDMPALIAAELANPDAGFVELHRLERLACENSWAKAAVGRRDWLAGMDHYTAATRDVLDGGDVHAILQRLARQVG
jgi:hypothetical protein